MVKTNTTLAPRGLVDEVIKDFYIINSVDAHKFVYIAAHMQIHIWMCIYRCAYTYTFMHILLHFQKKRLHAHVHIDTSEVPVAALDYNEGLDTC